MRIAQKVSILSFLIITSGYMQGALPGGAFKFYKFFASNKVTNPLRSCLVMPLQHQVKNSSQQIAQILSRFGAKDSFKKRFLHNSFGLKTIAFLGMGLVALAEDGEQHEKRVKELKAEHLNKWQQMLRNISQHDLTILYKCSFNFSIYKSGQEIKDKNAEDVKKMFEKQEHLVTGVGIFSMRPDKKWRENDWATVKASLLEDESGIHLDDTFELLEKSKHVLKTFMPSGLLAFDVKQEASKGLFIDKGPHVNRLFTYARLQKAIEEKKLCHVHLPLKILVIKDVKNGGYITGQKALKILDDMLKICVVSPYLVHSRINLISDDYELAVLAHKQSRNRCKLNENAHRELQELIKEAPFDVGYDNIFSDENGDAVIIDTEFKGEPAEDCLPKLGRYK